MFPLSFVEPCQTQPNMAYMSAWYIAIHGQMLPDYSQNINLVAAAPSRGSAGYWKHRGGTGDTVETCPDTITISNNTTLGEMLQGVVAFIPLDLSHEKSPKRRD